MTTFEKLAKRLKDDLGLETSPSSFRRTYAGKCLKAGGAFVWTCELKSKPLIDVGSCYTASYLVKSKTPLTMVCDERCLEIEIFPE